MTEQIIYSQTFLDNNTLSAIGNYRIVSFNETMSGIQITSYSDSVSIFAPHVLIERSFRWSNNNQTWSMWMLFDPMNPTELLAIRPNSTLYIEFKFQLVADDNTPIGSIISPVATIDSISFNLLKEKENINTIITRPAVGCSCSDEKCQTPVLLFNDKFTFNPYAVNNGLNLYQDLSNIVNQTFGHEIQYVRTVPKQRERDVILGEYTVYGDSNVKCLKVLVPNNEFPDAKPTFNQFGIDFEMPFEIHIDKGYWESLFGKNTMPQQFDVLLFPIMNRLYEVQSVYVFRDFMYQPLYYKVALVKAQNRVNRDLGVDIQEAIDEMSVSTLELFGEEINQERDRITKPQQYLTITPDSDPVRYSVNKQLEIPRYDLYNNWVLLTQNYYNLDSLYSTEGVVEALIYRNTFNMPANGNMSYMFWFANQNNNVVSKNLLTGRNSNGIGINIDIQTTTASPPDSITVTLNSNIETFSLPEKIEIDKWYALVVNVSQEFGQVGIFLWTMQAGKTAELRLIKQETKQVNVLAQSTDFKYRIMTSPLFLTNIRIFKDTVALEKQSGVLGQMIIKDANTAILIDNAKPVFRLPKIIDPK